MTDPFFTRKRKTTGTIPPTSSKKRKGKPTPTISNANDEEILSDDETGLVETDGSITESESERETPAEKRRRLAKQYIESVKNNIGEGEIDAAEIDRDLIAERLKTDALEKTGRAFKEIADTFKFPIDPTSLKSGRHDLAVTCIAIADNFKYFYTASKDCSIKKWDVDTGRKLHEFPGGRKSVKQFDGHTDHVLSLALSSDGKYLASGGADKKINIWNVDDNKFLKCFWQHKDAVTALAFRKGANQLYSASKDRSIKVWNIDELSYVETLYGHQDQVMAIDALFFERCVTVGSGDRTCRLWKIAKESQLVFRAGDKKEVHPGGGLDAVAMIDEDNFLTGSDNGTISLWNVNKKKPVYSYPLSHGSVETFCSGSLKIDNPRWIISLATLRYSNLFASGSWDGQIRLWKIKSGLRSFDLISSIPVLGFINSLSFLTSEKKTYLVIGAGQEHRLGRWERIKEAKNRWKSVEL
ncbi:2772_t:CDS:10 [Paraglomus brasilianum]|uniref:2772_t:CDS:1 n=1 Tax=Paraglomus brasilianum TaxID=144538 RepID=A0A9N9CWU6_9GLOM|nr:2772_t:CDS:10 [Paraglomus brasilianum]